MMKSWGNFYSRKIFRIHVIECAGRWGYNDDRVYVFTEFTVYAKG